MKLKKYRKMGFVFILLLSTIFLILADGFWHANYLIKSVGKFILFVLLPMGYVCIRKEDRIRFCGLWKLTRKSFFFSLLLGVTVFTAILLAYAIFQEQIDFTPIRDSLTQTMGVNQENFPFVSLYIIGVNSCMEELFFRGFSYLMLREKMGSAFAFFFSAGIFSVYHVGMLYSWFSIEIFILVMVSLFIGGCLFNLLDRKYQNLYPSWLVHMFANAAINSIGFMLFDIVP